MKAGGARAFFLCGSYLTDMGELSLAREPAITDKQQGWHDALNIVIGQFIDVAWQNGLGQGRERARC